MKIGHLRMQLPLTMKKPTLHVHVAAGLSIVSAEQSAFVSHPPLSVTQIVGLAHEFGVDPGMKPILQTH